MSLVAGHSSGEQRTERELCAAVLTETVPWVCPLRSCAATADMRSASGKYNVLLIIPSNSSYLSISLPL